MFSSLYRRYYKFVKIVWVFFLLRLNFTSLLVRTIAGGSGWQKSATLNKTNAALAHSLCVWAELHMCIHVCWVGAGAQLGSWLSLWTPSSSFFTSHCKTSPYQTPKLLISVSGSSALFFLFQCLLVLLRVGKLMNILKLSEAYLGVRWDVTDGTKVH